MKFPLILLSLSLLIAGSSLAQDSHLARIRVTIDARDQPFRDVLSLVQSQIPFKFAYSTELIRHQKKVSLTAAGIPLTDLLARLFKGTSLTFTLIDSQIVIENKILSPGVRITGCIKDARSGEPLPGASIYLPAGHTGTVSNQYGDFSITTPPADTMVITVSYVGYMTLIRQVRGSSDRPMVFDLERKQEMIHQANVGYDKREDNVRKNETSVVDLSGDMLMTVPSTAGGDLLQCIQLLPGVQTGINGTSGYSVRGGTTGQNLVLLDGATLYNPSHLFGLVSTFNDPAIRNARLIKGGFPACYGDNISSVLDVATKDGNFQHTGGQVVLSPIASGLTLYGPLRRQRSSFLISARRSTLDWWLPLLAPHYFFSQYHFYDLDAKLTWQVSQKDRLLFGFYKGRDLNAYRMDTTTASRINYAMRFGNQAFTLHWKHVFTGRLISNTSLVYDRHQQFLSDAKNGYLTQLYSRIGDIDMKMRLAWRPSPSHLIDAGADYLYQSVLPAWVSSSVTTAGSSLRIDPDTIPARNASRVAAWLSDDWRLSRRLDLYTGVRVPVYFTKSVRYLNLEPRISFRYLLGKAASWKISYTRMHQYIHLVQSYNASFPAEIWIGSSKAVLPEWSHEFSTGIYKNFRSGSFQASLEGYYKVMNSQLLFKGIGGPAIDKDIEDQLIFGTGHSYGAELLLRKNRGRLKGWLAYTLAYARQRFDSLNAGREFPFAFDRRHSLHLAAAYDLSAHWRLSGDLSMASRSTLSLKTLPHNNYALPPCSRLDLGISYEKQRPARHGIVETKWVFSIYNVYAHRNTTFACRAIDPKTQQVTARQVALIPVIPNLTYMLNF